MMAVELAMQLSDAGYKDDLGRRVHAYGSGDMEEQGWMYTSGGMRIACPHSVNFFYQLVNYVNIF
jgi:hypothetical protein